MRSKTITLLLGMLVMTPSRVLAAPTPYASLRVHEKLDINLRSNVVGDFAAGVFRRHVASLYGVFLSVPSTDLRGRSCSVDFNSRASQDQEVACRDRGGTPALKAGEMLCTMNPIPHRKSLTPKMGHALVGGSGDKAYVKMSSAREQACRDMGGTPDVIDGHASCDMNPAPDRGTLTVMKGVHRAVEGHGR
ncbi:hypothetical protein FPV67DRAFT_1527811 [Lyophyllum atratum]|nr:hypothetical protein FPV67DRAFT_1527811 [Lyophyllum atratum]